MILKTVTLQEANGLLPLVKEHFLRIHYGLARLHKLRDKAARGAKERIIFDENHEEIKLISKTYSAKKRRKIGQQIKEAEYLVSKEMGDVMRYGAVIRGLFPPHIDFLSQKNNEAIFLCWHGGEKEICHWHELDDGSPVRHVMPTDPTFGPHVVH